MRTLDDENITSLTFYKGVKTSKQYFYVAVAVKGEKYPMVIFVYFRSKSSIREKTILSL